MLHRKFTIKNFNNREFFTSIETIRDDNTIFFFYYFQRQAAYKEVI